MIGIAIRVGAAIEKVGGSYFVGGSLASSLQGEPRATNDIDIVLELPAHRAEALRQELGKDFEVDVEMLRQALLTATSANIFFLPLVTKIDLFALGSTPFDASEFMRRKKIPVRGDESLVIKSAEDTVLRKLLWFREGGGVSEKQWRDVVEVLRVSGPEIDESYLESWAARLQLDQLLQKAQAEAAGR
ncbi:MAG: hypothetical protein ACRELY_31725 [Polyangiaceae bacterium]